MSILFNKYAPDPITEDYNTIKKVLCETSQMDAWHDHHGIITNDQIKDLVNEYVPPHICDKPSTNEDEFMKSRLLNPGVDFQYTKPQPSLFMNIIQNVTQIFPPPDPTNSPSTYGVWKLNNTADIFTNWVDNRYDVMYCFTPEKGQNPGVSLIQLALNSQGITDDYFVIKDTAYGNYADDIRRTGEGGVQKPDQKITTLLTSQGIYDPGPTNTPFTDGGDRQGFNDIPGNSKFGMLDFSITDETITNYPPFPKDSPTFNKYSPFEQLLYSKYQCSMVASTDLSNPASSITKANSTLYIKDLGNNSLFYVDKTNSDKATDPSQLAMKEEYSMFCGLLGKINPPPGFTGLNLLIKSGPKKMFSKKVGDQGQALQTLRPVINYLEYSKNPGNSIDLIKKQSNGIHGFVSIDRCAIVAGIYFGAPLLIYVTQDGFVIYISKKLINTTYKKQIEEKCALLTNKIGLVDGVRTKVAGLAPLDSITAGVQQKMKEFSGKITQWTTTLIGKLPKDFTARTSKNALLIDTAYKIWLCKLFIWRHYANLIETEKYGSYLRNHATFLTNYDQVNGNITTIADGYCEGLIRIAEEADAEGANEDQITLAKRAIDDLNTRLKNIEELISISNSLNNPYTFVGQVDDVLADINQRISSIIGNFDTSEDLTKLLAIVKKLNPSVSLSISDVTTAQTVVNPSCLMNLLSCFGSGKKVFSIGPFYHIIENYQNIDITIPTIIQYGFVNVIVALNGLSMSANTNLLFQARLKQMDDQLQNPIDNALFGLTPPILANLSAIYNMFINQANLGGRKKRERKTRRKHNRSLRRRQRGGGHTADAIQRYLEVVSLISIACYFLKIPIEKMLVIFNIPELQLFIPLYYNDFITLRDYFNETLLRTYKEGDEESRFDLFKYNITGNDPNILMKYVYYDDDAEFKKVEDLYPEELENFKNLISSFVVQDIEEQEPRFNFSKFQKSILRTIHTLIIDRLRSIKVLEELGLFIVSDSDIEVIQIEFLILNSVLNDLPEQDIETLTTEYCNKLAKYYDKNEQDFSVLEDLNKEPGSPVNVSLSDYSDDYPYDETRIVSDDEMSIVSDDKMSIVSNDNLWDDDDDDDDDDVSPQNNIDYPVYKKGPQHKYPKKSITKILQPQHKRDKFTLYKKNTKKKRQTNKNGTRGIKPLLNTSMIEEVGGTKRKLKNKDINRKRMTRKLSNHKLKRNTRKRK